jgi:hypothetical protein
MSALIQFGSSTASCSGSASADGAASCSFKVDGGRSGQAVRVNACFTYDARQYCAQTQFTPQ